MKKEYLQAYQAKEREDFDRFIRKIQSHGLDPDDRYPSLQRLEIVHHLIVYSVCSTYRLIMKRFGLKFHLQELY